MISPWLAAALLLLDSAAIAWAVWRGRGVSATVAWIFAILVIPVGGAVAYFLIANPGIDRQAARKRRVVDAVRPPLPAKSTPLPDVLEVCEQTSGLPATGGNRCAILAEDAGAFADIAQAVKAASRSVWVEKYIIRDDSTGRDFLALLAERAAAGVDVRLLYDAVGSFGLGTDDLGGLTRAGASVAASLPLNPLRRRWSVHLRNHRKLILVDGEDAFLGGMNIGDEYAGRVRAPALLFRDTHMRVAGPAVAQLAEVFVEDWEYATDERLALPPPPPHRGDERVAVVPSGPDQRYNASAYAYFSAITEAEATCYLTSPYFVPDEPLVRALCAAAMRGVDTRVLVPRTSDVGIVAAAARSYYEPLLECGVRIYEYLPSMLHAKTLVTDEHLSVVGSANADVRSFALNFELGVVVESPELAGVLHRRFVECLAASAEIALAAHRATPWWVRLRWQLARLLSPLL